MVLYYARADCGRMEQILRILIRNQSGINKNRTVIKNEGIRNKLCTDRYFRMYRALQQQKRARVIFAYPISLFMGIGFSIYFVSDSYNYGGVDTENFKILFPCA